MFKTNYRRSVSKIQIVCQRRQIAIRLDACTLAEYPDKKTQFAVIIDVAHIHQLIITLTTDYFIFHYKF